MQTKYIQNEISFSKSKWYLFPKIGLEINETWRLKGTRMHNRTTVCKPQV